MIGPITGKMILAGAVGLLVGMATAGVAMWYRHQSRKREYFNQLLEDISNDGESVSLSAPEVGSGFFDVFKYIRHRQKAKRLAKRGYVKWFKYDGGMLQQPQWVKPKRRGAGVAEYNDGDSTYLFPEDALVTDAETGAQVAVHHTGQAEPVNISSPEVPPIDADRLDKVINLEIESDPPGLLSRLDFGPQMILYGGIALMLLLGGVQQFM